MIDLQFIWMTTSGQSTKNIEIKTYLFSRPVYRIWGLFILRYVNTRIIVIIIII